MEKMVALIVHLKGTARQVLTALPQSDTIECATLINCFEQRFRQKHLAQVKKRELRNRIQKSGEGSQDYVADIWRLAQEAYPNMNPEFVESTAVDSFIDGIWDWEVQSLVRVHSCKNIAAALVYALEVEAVRRASSRLVMVHQIREENPKEQNSPSSKGENTRIPTYCATKKQVSAKRKQAQEIWILQLGCDSSNVYIKV